MVTVGSGVIEIRVHADGEYRVFYVAKFDDGIYILHTFAKKTRKTSSLDIELGKCDTGNCWKGGNDASCKR